MIKLIGSILASGIQNLFKQQPDVLKKTTRTGMTEWNFGRHLASEIAKYIFWLNHDMDITKRHHKNRRPDIIFHKRGSNALNYLVIEIKCTDNVCNDIKKIKMDWMGDDLHYRFGSSIIANSNGDFKVTVFYKNSYEVFSQSAQTIELPKISESEKQHFISLVNQISYAGQNDHNATCRR